MSDTENRREKRAAVVTVGRYWLPTRPFVDAVNRSVARWLNEIGAEQHPEGRWTAERVESWHSVATYHVPLGGAVQS